VACRAVARAAALVGVRGAVRARELLHEAVKIQEHLMAQDKVLGVLIGKTRGLPG
jgi:hypothetical protein